nr:MAG TPA: hypothetical protein [Caudoviricetes sp.]
MYHKIIFCQKKSRINFLLFCVINLKKVLSNICYI